MKSSVVIHQLVYYSKSTGTGGGREMLTRLRDILATAQRNNSRVGVTGFLIFDKPWFVQILEGERPEVSKIYGRISRDPRHSGLSIVNLRNIDQRSFPNWSMGSAVRGPDAQGLYLKHGIGGPLDPTRINSTQIIALACDLLAFKEARQPEIVS